MNYLEELQYRHHRLIEEIAYCLYESYERKLQKELQKVNNAIEEIEYNLYKAN